MGLNQRQIEDLLGSVEYSRRELRTFRENRRKALDEFVGAHYAQDNVIIGDDRIDERCTPMNMIYFAAIVYSRSLASSNPQCYITTTDELMRPGSFKLEGAINHVSRLLDLGGTLNLSALDALFGMGACKVGVDTYGSVTLNGFDPESGCPFVDPIDLDDLVYDMAALRWKDVGYVGNRYRVPLADVEANANFDKAAVKELKASPLVLTNAEGDERVAAISRNEQHDDEFEERVELLDLFLPARIGRPAVLVTLPADGLGASGKPLCEIEWDGPPSNSHQVSAGLPVTIGPYHLLGFTEVPGNLPPLPPAAMWLDQHHLINCLARKIGDQALREKTVGAVPAGAEADATKICEARDGDAIVLSTGQQIQELHYGGANQNTFGIMTSTYQLFKTLNGNLDALAGLGPQADTLGQDQLIHAAASKMVEGMQARTLQFAEGIMRDLAWYLLTDPGIALPITRRIEEYGAVVHYKYKPANDQGTLLDYTIQIHPYSMTHMTPTARLQALLAYLNTVMPAMGQMAQQGATFDWKEFNDTYARLTSLDEIKRMMRFGQPPEAQNAAPGEALTKPPVTRRENVRINRSGTTVKGQEDALIAAAMGGRKQPAEAARQYRNAG